MGGWGEQGRTAGRDHGRNRRKPFCSCKFRVRCVCLHSLSPQLLPRLCFEGGCTLPLLLSFWGIFSISFCASVLLLFSFLLFVSLLVSSTLPYVLLLPEKLHAVLCEGEALRLAISLCTGIPGYTS